MVGRPPFTSARDTFAHLPADATGPEASADGVPLDEIDYRTMASRRVPGLHLVGELLDCDGRIGGFNFHRAWSTGYLAGRLDRDDPAGPWRAPWFLGIKNLRRAAPPNVAPRTAT